MPTVKPVRVIDISRSFNITTSTVIDFLSAQGYPVDRSHHTPLLEDILNEVFREYKIALDSELNQRLLTDAKRWESEHKEAAFKIREKYFKGKSRLEQKHERAKKVMAGRERARIVREEVKKRKEEISQTMQSVSESSGQGDGRIPVSSLSLEIIRRALALDYSKKKLFLKQLRLATNPHIQ